MLRLGILFLVLALIAGALGYGGLAGDSFAIGKILVFVFLVLAVISLVLNSRGGSTRDLV